MPAADRLEPPKQQEPGDAVDRADEQFRAHETAHVAEAGAVRELLGDGVFQGAYELSDDEVARIWQVGVEEVRELLESGWR